MTEYAFGNYGFLKQGRMTDPPFLLLDLGVERRMHEAYRFENAARASYGGYLLQYTLKGCGIYESAALPDGQDRLELSAGRGFFSRMPENSRYYLPSGRRFSHMEDSGWEFFFLHFDGPAVLPFFETVRALSGPVFTIPESSPPVTLFFQLFERLRKGESLALYEGNEFLCRFLTQLLRVLESPSAEGSPLVLQALSYFKNHFFDISGIGEAAEACGVSQAHLTRTFHAETGQTPLQYLTRLRIEHGLFLLLNTKDSIESIAVSCGFLNGNYFAKVFRRFLGCSPEEYRKRNRC